MEDLLTSELETRVPVCMDSLVFQRVRKICDRSLSQSVNYMTEAQVVHATNTAISSLHSNNHFMRPIMESIRLEIETRLHGAWTGVNAPKIQHINYSVLVEQSYPQLTDQLEPEIMAGMVGRADEFPLRTRPVGNDRKVAIRDDNLGTGRRASQFGSSRKALRKTKEAKPRRRSDTDDESSD